MDAAELNFLQVICFEALCNLPEFFPEYIFQNFQSSCFAEVSYATAFVLFGISFCFFFRVIYLLSLLYDRMLTFARHLKFGAILEYCKYVFIFYTGM